MILWNKNNNSTMSRSHVQGYCYMLNILASVEDLYAFVPLPPQLSVPFLLFPALLLQWPLGASVPQVSVHGKRAPTVEVEQ